MKQDNQQTKSAYIEIRQQTAVISVDFIEEMRYMAHCNDNGKTFSFEVKAAPYIAKRALTDEVMRLFHEKRTAL